MLKGFPSSNRISQGKFADISLAISHKNNNTIALVGFTSKGPINSPVAIRDSRQLRTMFGLPHPDQRESNLLYAAEQCLLVGTEVIIYRAADKTAKVASTSIPGADNLVKTHSAWPEPYVFDTNQFFRWKLDNKISGKTLVVLDTDEEGISAAQLADELNDQLNPKDGIQFYVHKEKYLGVRTTLTSKNELELVSIQDAMYGPWGVTGFGSQMRPAEKIGVSETDLYDLEFEEDLVIELVVTGSTNPTIDNVIQTIKLKGLEGKANKTGDIVDYINNVELPLLPGGWRAFAAGNAIGFRTKHAGRDASIVVKSGRASKIFGFDSTPAVGKSPKDEAIFFGSKNSSDAASLEIYADSPGVDGNNTRITVTNDHDVDTFTIDVFNSGIQVESWGQLTKSKNSRFYVESFINLVSEWVRVKDNTNNTAPPKNGSYLLGDEKVAGAVKGCDGIPSDLAEQDKLLIGDIINKTGVYSLADLGVDMIAVPGHSSDVVVNALLEVCNEQGMKCMAIIDPPMNLSLADTMAWVKSFKSDFGAVFWPWVQIRDAYNRRNVWVPPSGSVMAAIARSDALSAPWHAATGQARGVVPGVLDVFKRPTHQETVLLNKSNVNPIIHHVQSDNFAVSSQKTLRAGEVNTTRTLFYIEKKISNAIDKLTTGYDLSHDEFRGKVSQVCEYVLEQVKGGRGIHNYDIKLYEEMDAIGVDKKDNMRARIGVQPREASGVYNIDLVFHRIGISEKADTFHFDKGDN